MKKIVLITGASSGMGRESAVALALAGFRVYAGSRKSELLPKDIKDLIPVKLDLTSTKNIKETVKNILDKEKHIDVLINNAGYGLVSTLENVKDEEMMMQYDINVFGLLKVTREVIPIMRENKSGVIINISSFLGKIGLPLLAFYNSTKYAVEGITDSLRYELAPFNIRVHSIMPGFFDTNFARTNLKTNTETFEKNSPYATLVSTLAPQIIEQINHGNSPKEVAQTILNIIENKNSKARVPVGEKAKKFIPMKRELSDEEFEMRVKEYYGI